MSTNYTESELLKVAIIKKLVSLLSPKKSLNIKVTPRKSLNIKVTPKAVKKRISKITPSERQAAMARVQQAERELLGKRASFISPRILKRKEPFFVRPSSGLSMDEVYSALNIPKQKEHTHFTNQYLVEAARKALAKKKADSLTLSKLRKV